MYIIYQGEAACYTGDTTSPSYILAEKSTIGEIELRG